MKFVYLNCGLKQFQCIKGPYIYGGYLRMFAPIATAHPYSARKFECHVMHRACALSTKMSNNREGGHCYSFAWI